MGAEVYHNLKLVIKAKYGLDATNVIFSLMVDINFFFIIIRILNKITH